MTAPKVMIAEDEDLIRAEMQRLLAEHWPAAQVVALAEDGAHAVELWEEHAPDVAFLDIQMPGMTGLQAAKLMTERGQGKTQIVFVTAYDQHALAAFEAGAVDYLLKPVRPERLQAVVAKLSRAFAAAVPGQAAMPPELAAMIQNLAGSLKPEGASRAAAPTQWISASVGQTIKLIGVAEIIYFQSDNKYTRIVTQEGEALVRKTLRELVDELGSDAFKQIHRSTVVNFAQVASVTRDGLGKGVLKFKSIADTVDVSAAYMGLFKPD